MDKPKRTTISIPTALHKRIRIRCAFEGCRIADELNRVLEAAFPEMENPERKPSKRKATKAAEANA